MTYGKRFRRRVELNQNSCRNGEAMSGGSVLNSYYTNIIQQIYKNPTQQPYSWIYDENPTDLAHVFLFMGATFKGKMNQYITKKRGAKGVGSYHISNEVNSLHYELIYISMVNAIGNIEVVCE